MYQTQTALMREFLPDIQNGLSSPADSTHISAHTQHSTWNVDKA